MDYLNYSNPRKYYSKDCVEERKRQGIGVYRSWLMRDFTCCYTGSDEIFPWIAIIECFEVGHGTIDGK